MKEMTSLLLFKFQLPEIKTFDRKDSVMMLIVSMHKNETRLLQ